MNHYTFFLNVEYQIASNGFLGNFTANKTYSVTDYETVSALIKDCYSILKKHNGSVTFQAFHSGNDEKSLSRLLMQPYEMDENKKLMLVKWPSKTACDIVESELSMSIVKSAVLDAINQFKMMNENH